MALSPSPVVFGSVAVNSGTTTQAVTVTNNGPSTVTFTAGPSVSTSTGGNGTGNFGFTGTTCGATLAAGANCSVTVTYTAGTTAGPQRTGTLSLSVEGQAVTDTLTATTVNYSDAVSPGTLGFGTIGRTKDSAAQTVAVNNNGLVPLTLTATPITITGTGTNASEYQITANTCSANLVLAVNGTCTVSVRFSPTTANGAGSRPATLSVISNATTKTVNLTGTAN
jgi:hypothetical protein